jgi:hypothetical protein
MVGVVVGAVLTFVLQRFNLARSEQAETAERLRQDRLTAYGAFVGSAMEYSRLERNYWLAKHELSGEQTSDAGRVGDEARQGRANLRAELYRVRLLCDDDVLANKADEAARALLEINDAPTTEDIQRLAQQAREMLEEFIGRARSQIVPTNPQSPSGRRGP